MEINLDTILNILRIYPLLGYFFAILYSLLNMNLFGIIYTIIGGAVNENLNNLFKHHIFTKGEWSRRPLNMPKTGCGIFQNCDFKPPTKNNLPPGMPSGHAQTSFMFATFWSLYLYEKYSTSYSKIEKSLMYLTIAILYLIAFGVSWQRIYSGCHKSLQTMMGSILGLILGYGLYRIAKLIIFRIDKKYYEDIFKHNIPMVTIGISFIVIVSIVLLASIWLKSIEKS
jgi:membrane-associated phospholipid phosphatase